MDRCRLMLALACLVCPGTASAQIASGFTGFFSASIGAAHGGAIRDAGWTPGVSMAVVEANGWGAELDLSHVPRFDEARFLESAITTLMVNVTWVATDATELVRPYAVGGVGLLRTRACVAECQLSVSRTDGGFDVGGGVFVLLSETIGVRGDVRYFRSLQRNADLPLVDNGFFDFWRTSVGVAISWPVR